jgi:alpha-D-xyloside xylohydrolase
VVQDWQYYPQGQAGSNSFEASRYPDPAGMIKTLHDSLNCRFTISVWPSYASNNDNKNWKFMNSRGYLLPTNDYLGQTYDPFNDSAAYYYWKFIDDSLVSKGVDGFWPDATEPESYNWPQCVTAAGPSHKVFNIFPLMHSKNLYDGFRKSLGGKKRVCNLTRSYYAGSQRLGAAYWTGDIACEATTYAIQIPAGLNVCASGLPYFCTDIGGFLGNVDPTLLARWFQWGAFNPVFRIHGTRNTELWADPQKTVEAILVKYSNLRYRLFPYVYSLAWKVTDEGYTIMRGLPFDYRTDPQVRDRTDEFMFGPAFLVCPVTNILTTSRQVYLPAGTWYDFWTGATADGGKTITVQTPLETMPLYVKAGSIVPLAPPITHAAQPWDPIELRVYTGADGSFTLYDDEGDSYNYEQGVYATTPIRWDNTNELLTIGPTSGQYPGMPSSWRFRVVWVGSGHGTGGEVTAAYDKEIPYAGASLTLNKKTGEIGVLEAVRRPAGIGFSGSLKDRQYVVSVKGHGAWRLRLLNLAGRCVAEKNMANTGSCVLADHPASGIYLLSVTYGGHLSWKKSVIIP